MSAIYLRKKYGMYINDSTCTLNIIKPYMNLYIERLPRRPVVGQGSRSWRHPAAPTSGWHWLPPPLIVKGMGRVNSPAISSFSLHRITRFPFSVLRNDFLYELDHNWIRIYLHNLKSLVIQTCFGPSNHDRGPPA